jgi:hypothetical protein
VTRRARTALVGLLGVLTTLLTTVLATLLGTGVLGAVAARPAAAAEPPNPVILIGTGGLTWSDVDADSTPALWSFLRDGSTAALSVRSVFTNTCPVDGWLSLSAGNRAAAPRDVPSGSSATAVPCPPVPAVESGVVPGWDRFVHAADALRFDSRPGTLGEALTTNQQCIQAVGPGAGVGAAYTPGTVPRYAAGPGSELTSLLSRCRVTLVDVGSLRDPDDLPPGEVTTGLAGRRAQAEAIDERIAAVLASAPNGSDLVVASLSDAGRSERLRLVAAKGPHYGSGTLYSPSTRQEGLVQAADLTVTLLHAADVPVPDALGGAALRRGSPSGNSEGAAQDRLRHLLDFDEASHEVHALVPPFFNAVVYAQILIYLLAALVWKRDFGSVDLRLRMLRICRRVAVVAATIPASTFLANLLPWWRFPVPMLAVVGAVALFVGLISALAMLGPWGRRVTGPLAVVAVVTLLVLGGDVMAGSRLQISSLMGLQPVVGGRFYGMGNVTFALFGTAALLLCIAVSSWFVSRGQRVLGAVAAGAVGLLAVFVDGAPFWGADGGGPPALLPGLAYLVLAILGVRMTWRRGLLIGVVTAALFLLVGFLDWLRAPESRSHLGRFFQTLLDGGAWDVVARKLQQNIDILFGNYRLSLLVPIALVFVIYVLARPTSWGSRSLQRSYEAVPTLRPGLIALLITLTIGFAINDSGVAIPANGAIIAVPLIIAVSVRVLIDEARVTASTRVLRRG